MERKRFRDEERILFEVEKEPYFSGERNNFSSGNESKRFWEEEVFILVRRKDHILVEIGSYLGGDKEFLFQTWRKENILQKGVGFFLG